MDKKNSTHKTFHTRQIDLPLKNESSAKIVTDEVGLGQIIFSIPILLEINPQLNTTTPERK